MIEQFKAWISRFIKTRLNGPLRMYKIEFKETKGKGFYTTYNYSNQFGTISQSNKKKRCEASKIKK